MIAVRPPDYFPGIPFIALAAYADVLVLADTFQYSRQSFQNRAKLRNPQGWQWISIPLKSRPKDCPVDRAEIENREPWQRKHWRAFEYNYRSTPYFEYYESRFEPLFETEWRNLADLTCATVELLHAALDLQSELVVASKLDGRPETLPAVRDAVGAKAMLSLPDAAKHDRQYVDGLHVLEVEPPVYRQNFEGFEPDMSVVDLLFNYGPEARTIVLDAAHVRS